MKNKEYWIKEFEEINSMKFTMLIPYSFQHNGDEFHKVYNAFEQVDIQDLFELYNKISELEFLQEGCRDKSTDVLNAYLDVYINKGNTFYKYSDSEFVTYFVFRQERLLLFFISTEFENTIDY